MTDMKRRANEAQIALKNIEAGLALVDAGVTGLLLLADEPDVAEFLGESLTGYRHAAEEIGRRNRLNRDGKNRLSKGMREHANRGDVSILTNT